MSQGIVKAGIENMKSLFRRISLAFSTLLMAWMVNGQQALVIMNVRIIDGSGGPSVMGNVRIVGDQIDTFGHISPAPGDSIIDGEGLTLSPGFIDSHSHHDADYTADHHLVPVISQGITTIVVGQDGSSNLPLGAFFDHLEQEPPAVNIASYAGHNTLRWEVLGNSDYRREATADEIARMGQLLDQEMEAGALGMSTGLEYDPGIYSSPGEVLSLAKHLKPYQGRYISHMRSEDVELENAIGEIINIGRTCQIPVQISHFKIGIKAKWGSAPALIAQLNAAREEGVDITADVYPYTYWMSTLKVLFPKRDFTNREQAEYALSELTTPDGMLLSTYDANPDYVGKTIAEIARASGENPADTYLRLIRVADEKHGDESVIGTGMDEEDISLLYQWPETNVCSDGNGGSLHPRGYGAFPRFIRMYTRDSQVLTLEEAVHKMTGLTAQHLGIRDRGIIAPGKFADLVLWDPQTITDHATTAQPHALCTGIKAVWVNGVQVWDGKDASGALPGRVIRRE